jgi:hypothetical protein
VASAIVQVQTPRPLSEAREIRVTFNHELSAGSDDNKTYWVAFTSLLLMATPLTPGNPLVAGPSLGN